MRVRRGAEEAIRSTRSSITRMTHAPWWRLVVWRSATGPSWPRPSQRQTQFWDLMSTRTSVPRLKAVVAGDSVPPIRLVIVEGFFRLVQWTGHRLHLQCPVMVRERDRIPGLLSR